MTQKQSSASGEQPSSGPRLSALKQGQLSLSRSTTHNSEQYPPHQEPSRLVLTAAQWLALSRPAETTRTRPDEAIKPPSAPSLPPRASCSPVNSSHSVGCLLTFQVARVLPLTPGASGAADRLTTPRSHQREPGCGTSALAPRRGVSLSDARSARLVKSARVANDDGPSQGGASTTTHSPCGRIYLRLSGRDSVDHCLA